MKAKEKKLKKIEHNVNGITLIALVVTIIVLIILAGVSINLVLGDNGIIQKAKDAKTETEQAKVNEEVATNELMAQWDDIVGGIGSSIDEGLEQPTEPFIPTTVEEAKKGYVTEKATVEDSYGNKIVIPEGFKIAIDSGDNVTQGIVIEDNDLIVDGKGETRGNQYVWIPVGEGIKKSEKDTIDITLGRYVFADGTNHKDEEGNALTKGTPILKQSADDYEDETEINIQEIDLTSTSNYAFKELKTNRLGVASTDTDGLNTTALDLAGFINSVKENGGYYIARYEASYGTDGKVNSKVSNSYAEDATVPTTEGTLWNNITQIDSATASRDLYKVGEKVTVNSDLINSYAWDTAIVYIQEFSGDTDYSRQDGKSINASLTNTGLNGDEVCKINDMASNTREWTTEYCTFIDGSYANCCTFRGGSHHYSSRHTSYRGGSYTTDSNKYNTFRSILYL